MIDIQSLVPDFSVDMRYAGSANFAGTVITGYAAPRCYLLKPVAEALRRVDLALRKHRLRLKVFDCYRPVRAVQHFVRWAHDLDDQGTKPRYYPNLDKRLLLGDYIAPTSGHSRGATMDLTLTECGGGKTCSPLDMGTDFDFFDVRANTDAADVTPAQHRNRLRLRSAMEREGFQNYPQEWWHYTFKPEPSPDIAYDFPIE
jgi:D-alanyl-D-alanine dipeptidase